MRVLSSPLQRGSGRGGLALLAGLLLLAVSRPAEAVPAFARQTDQPCSSCHIGAFGPQLTPFGIAFKMSGYTLTAGDTPYPYIPLSAMLLTSFNNTADPVQKQVNPTYGTNNNYNLDQISLFLAGALSSYAGGLVQITYSGTSPTSAFLDDSDVRLTHAFDISSNEVRIGLDFNDGPTVQDPYNTLYHYAYPYASSAIAPTPVTAPLAIQALAGNSLGLTNYYWINQTWYFEAGGYKSLSTTWANALGESYIGHIEGVAPYVRLAWQKIWGNNFLEIGGVLFGAALQEANVIGPGTNDYYDYGIDANYQYQLGNHTFAIATNLIQQQMNLGASYAAGQASKEWNDLTQFRIMGDYYYKNTYGFTLAFNDTFGSHDALLYAPAPLVGSANGSPNYKSITAELDWVPFGKSADTVWDFEKNLKIGLQYTAYLEFNGGTSNFDGYGHNASGMNTLYLYAWLAW
jgi:hypothetical protein